MNSIAVRHYPPECTSLNSFFCLPHLARLTLYIPVNLSKYDSQKIATGHPTLTHFLPVRSEFLLRQSLIQVCGSRPNNFERG